MSKSFCSSLFKPAEVLKGNRHIGAKQFQQVFVPLRQAPGTLQVDDIVHTVLGSDAVDMGFFLVGAISEA